MISAEIKAWVRKTIAQMGGGGGTLLLNNNQALRGKDTGGVAHDLLKVNASDQVVVGDGSASPLLLDAPNVAATADLAVVGNCQVDEDLTVFGTAVVSTDLTVNGTATVGAAEVDGDAAVDGNLAVSGSVTLENDAALQAKDTANTPQDVLRLDGFNVLQVASGGGVTGIKLAGPATEVAGDLTADGNVNVTGDVQAANLAAVSNLDVEGDASFNAGSVNINSSNVVLSSGDFEAQSASNGVILKDDGGQRWRVRVGEDGSLFTTAL